MGQRSQIYIRFNDSRMKSGKGLIALYYQWNFGERMVSRARQIIEMVVENQEKFDNYLFDNYFFDERNINMFKRMMKRVCTVNFDMRAVDVIPTDIFREAWEFSEEDIKEYLFNQDNNDGCLLVDILYDKNTEKASVKYALTDSDFTKIFTPDEYMTWDRTDITNNEYYDDEDRKHYKDNSEYITTNARLMTKDEIDEFIQMDYSVENAFDYENLIFQYECAKKLVLSAPHAVKTFDDLKTLLKGVNDAVLCKVRDDLQLYEY